MTNCLFYTLFFALFLNVSFGALRFSQINRSFMSIFKGMLEASVMTIDINGNPSVPYYNKNRVIEYSETYLSKNISRFTKEFTVDIVFYNKETGLLCDENCEKVKISLNAKINTFYSYDKSQTFVIRNKDEI